VCCSSSRENGASDTVALIRGLGGDAWMVHGELADRAALQRMADDAEEAMGTVEVLVNNAGSIARYRAADLPIDEWDRVLRTNVDAAWLLSQRFGREMIARRSGKIVNVASLLSFTGGINVAAYAASKHAVAGLTKALANEWASSNVQVNAIAPGYFVTDNTRLLREDRARVAEISARIPAGRWGEPPDLAGAVVFLASAASDYVNGHVLVVDGGWTSR
jgi:2-deoxy-D-gluconate 3-dehydrogenase